MSFERELTLIGEERFARLAAATVVILGLGGVGSYAAEAIVRAGIGHIIAVDSDVISASNLNRQLLALTSAVGQKKTDVFRCRAKDINPEARIDAQDVFIDALNVSEIITGGVDYVIDAIDTVSSKLAVIEHCHAHGIRLISCMGTGNKLDTSFAVTDIYKTDTDPLARTLRRELKKRGIDRLTVVCSSETPQGGTLSADGRHIPGSISYVPGSAGLVMAGHVIRELMEP